MKVAGPGEAPPPPGQVEREMARAFSQHTIRSRVRTAWEASHTWEAKDWDQYAHAWNTLANAYRAVGDLEGSGRCRGIAEGLSPMLYTKEITK